MSKPDFFIVGAPKCGTTALFRYLGQHPEIFTPAAKEPTYFGSDLTFCDRLPGWYFRDLPSYLQLFSGAENYKRAGEASPHYLQSRRAAKEIRGFCPQARIIVMLRSPVDFLCSLHANWLISGNEDILDFETALEAESDRRHGRCIPRTAWNVEGLCYRDNIRFSEQVRRYLSAFGRDQVHVIIFDDFRSDTAGVYDKVLRFLDVKPFQADTRVVNRRRRFRSWAMEKWLRNPPRVLRRAARAVLPRALCDWGINRIRRANTTVGKGKPLDDRTRRKLNAEFLPEVEALSDLLGRDLTSWCKA